MTTPKRAKEMMTGMGSTPRVIGYDRMCVVWQCTMCETPCGLTIWNRSLQPDKSECPGKKDYANFEVVISNFPDQSAPGDEL